MSTYGYFSGKGQKKAEKKINRKKFKIEGTSVTYGQSVYFESDVFYEGGSRTPPSYASRTKSVPALAKDPPTISSNTNPDVQHFVVPNETKVKAICNTKDAAAITSLSGQIGSLPNKAKSNIAIAAASENENATVVLDNLGKSNITKRSTDKLFGSTLNDIATTTPNCSDVLVVLGSSYKTKEQIKKALVEAQKIDLMISLKSKPSESIEFNSLKVPNLDAKFVYNFFVEDEDDIEEQERQDADPLLKNKPIDVSKYVELKWNIVGATEPLKGTEEVVKNNQTLRRNVFFRQRGVIGHASDNFKDSVEKNKKKYEPIKKDNLSKKVTDIHNIEDAFLNIQNNYRFANSISSVISARTSNRTISIIPVAVQEKKTRVLKKESKAKIIEDDLPFLFPKATKILGPKGGGFF